jgi:virginiamycin B lyase
MTTSRACILVLAIAAGSAFAGGSNYGITPGALKQVAGQAREWPVPTPSFARDPAPSRPTATSTSP